MINERDYNPLYDTFYTDPYEDALYEEKEEIAYEIPLSSVLNAYQDRLEELLKPLNDEIKEKYIEASVKFFEPNDLVEEFFTEVRNAKKYSDIRKATEDDDLFIEFIDEIEDTDLKDELYSLMISENSYDDLKNW